MVTIGIVFKDATMSLNDDNARRQFLIQSVVPQIMDKLTQAGGVTRAADPVMDQRGVSISVGVTF